MLGGGDRVAEGRVHHDDAPRGCRLDVDVVDADARSPDDLELLGRGDDLRGGLGRGSHGETVVGTDDFFELVFGETDVHVDGDAALFEDGDGRRGKLIRDQDFC